MAFEQPDGAADQGAQPCRTEQGSTKLEVPMRSPKAAEGLSEWVGDHYRLVICVSAERPPNRCSEMRLPSSFEYASKSNKCPVRCW